jgi:hypothetical protein
MDEHGRTLGRPLKGGNYRCQHIVVGMLDGGEVVSAGHWCSGCEKVKGKFDGDQSVSAVPS